MSKKPRKAGVTSEEQAKLAAVMASLEKTHGKGVLQTLDGSPSVQRFERQIPSGSIGLDIALGVLRRMPDGRWMVGYPDGRIVEIFGPEGSGKTTLALLAIANAQAIGIRCAFLDMEHQLDPTYARALGVNLEDLLVSQPNGGETCMRIADELLGSGLFGLIVVDSAAALIPNEELEGEIGDASVGAQARLIAQSLRKMSTKLSTGIKCNLFFTNQLRDKIGGMGNGPKETTPGGRALKFYANIRIRTWAGEKLKETEGGVAYGQKVGINVIKNKCAPPFREAQFDMVFGRGVDYVAELLDLSIGRGFITLAGSWYSIGKTPMGQGRRAACDHLRADAAMCYTLYDRLLTEIMAERGHTPTGEPIPGMVQTPSTPTMVSTFQPIPAVSAPASLNAA